MGLLRVCLYDVGAQYGEFTVFCPAVEHVAPCLYVMVTYVPGVILHIVQHFGAEMHRCRVYIIIVIGGRLSLQNVSIVQQYQTSSVCFAFFVYIAAYA